MSVPVQKLSIKESNPVKEESFILQQRRRGGVLKILKGKEIFMRDCC
jgi:hypothetical protein